MEYTTNYNLKKLQDNDNADLPSLCDNFNIIDEALTPAVDQATAPPAVNQKGKLAVVLGWIANRIKAITGKTNWWDAPAKTLQDLHTHITNGGGTSAVAGHVKLINGLSTISVGEGALDAVQGKLLNDELISLDSWATLQFDTIFSDMGDFTDEVAIKADRISAVTATSSNGISYSGSITTLDALYDGLIIPVRFDRVSDTILPTLNINGTGAIGIRRWNNDSLPWDVTQGIASNWLQPNRTYTLKYTNVNGNIYWIATEFTRYSFGDLNGISNVMQKNASQTMTAQLIADKTQSETVSQVRNAVIMPSGTTVFSGVENGTLIFVKE